MNRELKWFDAIEWGCEGRGWADTRQPYDRLPARAEQLATADVWNLSHSPTGMCVHFNTDSPEIHIRWKLGSEQLGEDNFNIISFSGMDLYVNDGGSWRWAATTPHFQVKDTRPEVCMIEGLAPEMRRCRVYLPQRNPVLAVEIGVVPGAAFEPVPPRRNPPLVYYGTSIVHGAFTARSGLGCPQMLARELALPLVNLGFSGNARMEAELAALFAELDAAMFLIDPLANMDAKLVEARAEPFLRILCEKRPEVPVFQIESPQPFGAWTKPGDVAAHREKIVKYRAAFSALKGEGAANLHYIDASGFYGEDNDASTDYVHPNDLGHKRMSDGLAQAVRAALAEAPVKG